MHNYTTSYNLYIYTIYIYEIKFQVGKIFCFERSLLRSPMLHLFDQKYCKIEILWNIITISNNCFVFYYILKCN